MEILVF